MPKVHLSWLNDPHRLKKWQAVNDSLTITNKTNAVQNIYRIPVVVHVIHTNGIENISEEQIKSQITVLNEDYRKIAETPGFGLGADTEIEFYLAQKDPSGQPTNGINRIYSSLTIHNDETEELTLKNLIRWPVDRYLNIWVVRSIKGNVLGYTRFPDEAPELDGVVCQHSNFGRIGTVRPPYNKGRTITHEVGHWLGLYHIFEEGCKGTDNTNCATQGDRVCDTPPTANENGNYHCPPFLNSCIEYPVDIPDQLDNYLDYLDDSCMSRFTNGQKQRMQNLLRIYRNKIYSDENLAATGWNEHLSSHSKNVLNSLKFSYYVNNEALYITNVNFSRYLVINMYNLSGEKLYQQVFQPFELTDNMISINISEITSAKLLIVQINDIQQSSSFKLLY